MDTLTCADGFLHSFHRCYDYYEPLHGL